MDSPTRMIMTNSPASPCVLVIDDNQVVRDILNTLLSRAGYRVVQAASGEEGIALYRDHPQDICLVLLDVQMPRKNGITTLTDLRTINPAVRCLLMTGDETRDEVLQAEAAGVVAKPFAPASLLKALKKAGVPPCQLTPKSLDIEGQPSSQSR
jgi:CheY-like chemotaxis protein